MNTNLIFNANKMGYHLVPNQTLAYKGEKCKRKKNSKDSLTINYINHDGSKNISALKIGE